MREQKDYMIRATAADGQIRAFAITSRDTVEQSRKNHNTSPVVTAALGRLMTAGVMMGSMMKADRDLITLQIEGNGPVRGMTVTADNKGDVKGYAYEPQAMVPASKAGKLDVGELIGPGMLRVIKDMGMKEPYVGQTYLQTSEIAEDLTYYFATSEQVPSSVGLGVLMEKNNTVRQAGGFIIQLMPFAEDEIIDKLEENLKQIDSVTAMLDQGYTPEMLLDAVLAGMDVNVTDTMPVRFFCNCSRQRVEKALISIGEKDLQEMVDDGEDIEVKCDFCNTKYSFTPEELQVFIDEKHAREGK